MTDLTPREIVSELDRYIIGQRDAKRAVAVALRSRWRRKHLGDDLRRGPVHLGNRHLAAVGVGDGCGGEHGNRRHASRELRSRLHFILSLTRVFLPGDTRACASRHRGSRGGRVSG